MDKITVSFLRSEGWLITEEKPLHTSFSHSKNDRAKCSISVYGGFNICELHWCNDTPERQFMTTNHKLTVNDYYDIISMLALSF